MSGPGYQKSSTKSNSTMGNVSSSNPYFNTTVGADGKMKTSFAKGSAGETAYNFVNKNISNLLDSYLNPSLDSATNQAKINSFNKLQGQNLQNNIISPLQDSNMVRSSQATNMYNNLSNQSANFANDLIANNQQDNWNMINNLMNLYTTGYQGVNSDSNRATQAALGSGYTTSKTSGGQYSTSL